MKIEKRLYYIFFGILFIGAIGLIYTVKNNRPTQITPNNMESANQAKSASSSLNIVQPSDNIDNNTVSGIPQQASGTTESESVFSEPLDNALNRVTKKPFGIYVSPGDSPVSPERFSGYHTGADFEIFSDEDGRDVPVMAVCSGTLAIKRFVSGYGGVVIENCMLDGKPITVLYGHLKLASITKKAGDKISAGETIAILGKGYSAETDGERKHLHLGIRRGSQIDYKGYVSRKSDLADWIDAMQYLKDNANANNPVF